MNPVLPSVSRIELPQSSGLPGNRLLIQDNQDAQILTASAKKKLSTKYAKHSKQERVPGRGDGHPVRVSDRGPGYFFKATGISYSVPPQVLIQAVPLSSRQTCVVLVAPLSFGRVNAMILPSPAELKTAGVGVSTNT